MALRNKQSTKNTIWVLCALSLCAYTSHQVPQWWEEPLWGIQTTLPLPLKPHPLSHSPIWVGWHQGVTVPMEQYDGRTNDLVLMLPFVGSQKQTAQKWRALSYKVLETDSTLSTEYMVAKTKTVVRRFVYQKQQEGIEIIHLRVWYQPKAFDADIERQLIQGTQLKTLPAQEYNERVKALKKAKQQWRQAKADTTLYIKPNSDEGWGTPKASDLTTKNWILRTLGDEF